MPLLVLHAGRDNLRVTDGNEIQPKCCLKTSIISYLFEKILVVDGAFFLPKQPWGTGPPHLLPAVSRAEKDARLMVYSLGLFPLRLEAHIQLISEVGLVSDDLNWDYFPRILVKLLFSYCIDSFLHRFPCFCHIISRVQRKSSHDSTASSAGQTARWKACFFQYLHAAQWL